MDKRIIPLIFCLGAAVYAKRHGYDRLLRDPTTYECCWPPQFSADLLTTGGYPEHVPGIIDRIDKTLHYDAPNNRWAISVYVQYYNGDTVNSTWIEDYKLGRNVQLQNGKCEWNKMEFKGPLSRCCNKDHGNYIERPRMGAREEAMAYDVHEWKQETLELGEVTFNVRTQVQTCLPVAETGWWKVMTTPVNINLEFVNVKLQNNMDFLDDVFNKHKCKEVIKEGQGWEMARWELETYMKYLRNRFLLRDPEVVPVDPVAKPVRFQKEFPDDF